MSLLELDKDKFLLITPSDEKEVMKRMERLSKVFSFDQTHEDLIDSLIGIQSFASTVEDYILLVYDLGLLKGTLAVTYSMKLDEDEVLSQLLKNNFVRPSFAFWAGIIALSKED